MEKLNLQNNNLNPRLYIYSKYTFSIGYFSLILAVFLLYLGTYKNLIPINNLIISDIAITILAAILFFIFIFTRIKLHKKSSHKLSFKDKKWYAFTGVFVIGSFIIVITWLIIIKSVPKTEFLIGWIISLVIVVAFSFISSVFEYIARFEEFAKVATAFEIQAKENDIILAKQYSDNNQSAESVFNNLKTEDNESEEGDQND